MKTAQELAPGEVYVIAEGILYLSACAPGEMEGPDVADAVRRQRVAGTSTGWQLSDEKTFANGFPNPCQCDQDAARQHWLFTC